MGRMVYVARSDRGGRGLKLDVTHLMVNEFQVARSDRGGRGLKHLGRAAKFRRTRGGRGLKQQFINLLDFGVRVARSDRGGRGLKPRVVEVCECRPARLLVQSRRAPQATPDIHVIGAREIHPRPTLGQRLAFLLTANPIKTIADAERDAKPDKKSDKCRVPLIRENDQREWLRRKLAVGAEVEAAAMLPHSAIYFRKGKRGGKLVTVTFEGVLRVGDPNALATLLENGVGPAKAFGCGLTLVRRIG